MLTLVKSVPCSYDLIPATVLTYKATVKSKESDWLIKNFVNIKPSYSTLAFSKVCPYQGFTLRGI